MAAPVGLGAGVEVLGLTGLAGRLVGHDARDPIAHFCLTGSGFRPYLSLGSRSFRQNPLIVGDLQRFALGAMGIAARSRQGVGQLPMPPPGDGAASLAGTSVIMASAVINRAAIEPASWSAVRTTFAGSTMPALIIST